MKSVPSHEDDATAVDVWSSRFNESPERKRLATMPVSTEKPTFVASKVNNYTTGLDSATSNRRQVHFAADTNTAKQPTGDQLSFNLRQGHRYIEEQKKQIIWLKKQ